METTKLQPARPTWEIEARQRERRANKVQKNKQQEKLMEKERQQWWKQQPDSNYGYIQHTDGNIVDYD